MSEKSKLDVENEMGLMGCILTDAQVWLPMVLNKGGNANWFRHHGIRSIFMAVKALQDAGKPVDLITALEKWRQMWDRQENGQTQKGEMQVTEPDVALIEKCYEDCTIGAHAEYYADLVREHRVQDMARSLGREFAANVGHGANEAIQQMMGKMQDLLDEATRGGRRYSREIITANIAARVQEAYRVVMTEGQGKVRYCPGLEMPWQHMNNKYGSMMPGLHIVSGRPSTGKTTLINNFIRFWCDGLHKAGGVNSMDMTPEMFLARNVAELSSVSLPKALKGDLRREQLDGWMHGLEKAKTWNLELDSIKDLDQFRSWVTVGVRKKGWSFVVIDFIQLMKFKGSMKMGGNDRIEILSGSIKELANDLSIPIICLSQLSRDSEKDMRKPMMSDLRGGGSLEQDAKTVLMLWRDLKVSELWKDCPPIKLAAYSDNRDTNTYMAKRLRPVFASLEKNQDGETGDLPLVMYPNYFRFRMGDYRAETVLVTDPNSGKTKDRHEADKFGRVHPDWRCFAEDQRFAKAGGLVTDYEDGVE